jgi:asparagine synthase (glutamine-hydrolysing)
MCAPYHFDGKTFLFGSNCAQLFQDSHVSIRVDEEKIAEWFTWCGILNHSYRNLRKSFFQDIFELPPAHYLLVDESSFQLQRYWDIDPDKEIRYQRREEYGQHFASLLKESVRCRLRSVTPVGAELSGGYDSSSIVSLAAEILRPQTDRKLALATFSLVFDELSCDERPIIDSVVRKYQLESHEVVSDGLCGLSGIGASEVSLLDINGPEQPHALKALQALYQLAHSAGIRVMLSGEGAEPHVLGNRFVLDSIIRHGRWGDLVARLRVMLAESSARSVLGAALRFGIVPVMCSSRVTRG